MTPVQTKLATAQGASAAAGAACRSLHDALRQTPADAYTKERARLCMNLFGAVTLMLRDIEHRIRQ